MQLIRQALEPDVSAIESLANEAYSHYIARIGKPPGPTTDNYHLLVEKHYVWVLVLDDEIVGLLALVPEPNRMLLDNVAIRPARQRSGLGRYLISLLKNVQEFVVTERLCSTQTKLCTRIWSCTPDLVMRSSGAAPNMVSIECT
jgi:N-acetylglutamate synthase-like GNAT family acetyltransferase